MWLDDCDDLLVVVRVQRPVVIAVAALISVGVVGATLFVFAAGHHLLPTR
jgi:hypothetical protein